MATSGCYGYTFGTQTGMCSLYGKAIHLNTYVSSTTTDMALFHLTEVSGTNYKDIDLDTIEPAANTGACIQACVSNPACVGFSYNTFDMSNQVCDLKSQMTTPEDNANFTSYFMPKSIYNTHTNSAYGSVGSTTTTAPGNSTNTWTSSDPISMAAQCDADPSCLGFMYNGSQFCRIDSTNLLATPTTATGTTTYFKQGTDPLAIQQFLPIPQTALQGGNVDKNAVHTGSTVPACASLCQANKQCIGFVFDTSTSTCTLKKIYSGHGTNVLKGDTTATTYISQPSGYTATLNSMVPSVSSDKTLLNTTPNGCADACTANKGCRGFVYIHATNQCYLKKEISTAKQDNNFILYTRE